MEVLTSARSAAKRNFQDEVKPQASFGTNEHRDPGPRSIQIMKGEGWSQEPRVTTCHQPGRCSDQDMKALTPPEFGCNIKML